MFEIRPFIRVLKPAPDGGVIPNDVELIFR